MKKTLLLFAIVFAALTGMAQDTYNLILFSEDGEPFFAYVNGIRQNDKPETNIRVAGLNAQAISVRVQFENAALPTLKQNMAPEAGYEHTVRIKKTMKKVMKMQYFGKVELAQAPRTNATTVQYHTSENDVVHQDEVMTDNGTIPTSEVSVPSTTTSINTSVHSNSSVVVNSPGVNINITTTDVPSTNPTPSSTMAVSSATRSNHGHTTKHGNVKPVNEKNTIINTNPASSSITPRPMNPALTATTAPTSSLQAPQGLTTNTETMSVPKNKGNSACGIPMNDETYEKLKTTIDEKPFEDNKMSIAQAATKSNCLSVVQIKGICDLFAMDDKKLAYAKYAYPFCVDKQNYFQVSDVFTFPRYTEDLNKFLQQQK